MPFNLCSLTAAAGASYVSRWTTLHIRQLIDSILHAIQKKGFSFIEVIASCPTSYGRRNKLGTPLKILQHFHQLSVIKNGIDPKEATLDINKEIVVGNFVNIERPTFFDLWKDIYHPSESDEKESGKVVKVRENV